MSTVHELAVSLTPKQWGLFALLLVGFMARGRHRSRARRRYRTNRRLRRYATQRRRDDFTATQRAKILARYGGCCYWCRVLPPYAEVPVHYESRCRWVDGCNTCFEADHYYPRSKGGPTTVENGVASCRFHNRLKSDRDPDEFRAMASR